MKETKTCLELFSGRASFSTVAKTYGYECRTVDNDSKFEPTYLMDIMDFTPETLGGWKPAIIWASPPCEAFSTNTIGKNWRDGIHPKTEKARNSLRMVLHTLQLIKAIQPIWFVIENPRAMLRNHMWLLSTSIKMECPPRKTVTYCQYELDKKVEERRMKPTDIWTNVPFMPKMCKYGSPCHRPAPRGSYSGQSYEELAVVPAKLCEDILDTIEGRSKKYEPTLDEVVR